MNTDKKNWISDKGFFWLVLGISLVIPVVVVLLQMIPAEMRPSATFAKQLPMLNAVINSLVSICLFLGYRAIRYQKNKGLHQKFMLASFILSSMFLISYVIYHLTLPPVPYCNPGIMKVIYLVILASHIILAAVILPMVLYTIYFSTSGKFEQHKKLARWTYPLWLYVSVTGVVVYLMLAPCLK